MSDVCFAVFARHSGILLLIFAPFRLCVRSQLLLTPHYYSPFDFLPMKKCLMILLCCCSLSVLHAQISGRVSQSDGHHIAFARVLLTTAEDSSQIQGMLTDMEGSFEFSGVEAGHYLVQIYASGFSTWVSETIDLAHEQAWDCGLIELEAYAIELDAVDLQAQRSLIQQTQEGTVLHVQSSVMTQGSSALQVLERSPGIFIDRQNGGIALHGQSGVKVMINGKLVPVSVAQVLTMLEGMQADNIEKIEFLTSPSARHDAEGSAGLINIVLKKQQDLGSNGSLALSLGYGWAEKGMASLNLNHRTEKNHWYAMYNFSRDHSFSDFRGIGEQNVPVLGGEMKFDFSNETSRILNSHNLTVGWEHTLDESLTIGASATALRSHTASSIDNLAYYLYPGDSSMQANIHVGGENHWNNVLSSLFVEKTFSNTGQLRIDADYLYFQNQSPTIANNVYHDDDGQQIEPEAEIFAQELRGLSETVIQVGVLKADYEQQIHPKATLEMGLKGSYAPTQNQGKIELKSKEEGWITDQRSINSLEMVESIGAAYVSSQIQIDSTIQLRLGLRYEAWSRQIEASDLSRKRKILFPSFFLSKQLCEEQQLHLSYTQRIARPEYNDLVSYLQYNGPISVFTGNPLLQPTLTKQLKLNFQHKSNRLALVAQHVQNPIARYQITENETRDLVIVAPQNVDYVRSLSLETDIPWEIFDWWNISVGGNIGLREFQLSHTKETLRQSYVAYTLYGNQTLTLPGDFSLELSGWYNGPFYEGSREYDGFGMLNAGIRKRFKGQGGSLQFTVSDVLKSMKIGSYFGTVAEEAFSVQTRVVYKAESGNARIFRLSYTYNFGNQQVKSKRAGRKGAEEEKARVRTQ